MENLQTVVLFLASGSVVASLILSTLKDFIKTHISPRFGDIGVLVVLFIISFVVSGAIFAFQYIPSNILTIAGVIFSGAIAVYQVLYKAIIRQAIMGKTE